MRAILTRLTIFGTMILMFAGGAAKADPDAMHESAAVIAQRTVMHKLHAAVRTGDRQAIDEALAAGADLDGSAALELAILMEREDLIDYLVERGADVNRTGLGGELPIAIAVRRGRPELVQRLIDKGADVGLRDRRGMSAMDHARRAERGNEAELLRRDGAREN